MQRKTNNQVTKRAFTLVGLVTTIAFIGILALVIMPLSAC